MWLQHLTDYPFGQCGLLRCVSCPCKLEVVVLNGCPPNLCKMKRNSWLVIVDVWMTLQDYIWAIVIKHLTQWWVSDRLADNCPRTRKHHLVLHNGANLVKKTIVSLLKLHCSLTFLLWLVRYHGARQWGWRVLTALFNNTLSLSRHDRSLPWTCISLRKPGLVEMTHNLLHGVHLLDKQHFEKTADRWAIQVLLQHCCLAERPWSHQLVQQVPQGRLCFQSWTSICLVMLVAETGLVLRSASVLQAQKCNSPLPLQT